MARIVDELKSLEPHGVPERIVQKLIDAGVQGVTHIVEMTEENLQTIEGIGEKTAEKIREAAALAKVDWDAKDAEENARLEAQRVADEAAFAAEQAAEQVAAAAGPELAAEPEAAAEGAPTAPPEGEAVAVAPVGAGEGTHEEGEPDGQR